jgi:hypothetical protein
MNCLSFFAIGDTHGTPLQLNSDEMPAHSDSKILRNNSSRYFYFSIPIARISLSLVWPGNVRTGFSELLVCGGRAPRERRGIVYSETMPACVGIKKLARKSDAELIKFWTYKNLANRLVI